MALISVIIPAFNAEKTIRETIESVLNQTFKDFDLIIINDGSQDATLDIVLKLYDSRLKVFSYQNSGANVSRNRGFSQANSEFIAFLDADDLWMPNKLETQWRVLQENTQAAVAYSWCDVIDESGNFLRQGSHATFTGNVYAKLLLGDFLDNGSNPLIRRQAFMEVGGFDESLPAAQDWDLYLRLAARYNFVCVPSTQILYRVSLNSISSDVYRLESACRRMLERAFSEAPTSLEHLKPYSLANIYKYLTYKVLQAPPERQTVRQKGLMAIRLLWLAVRYDPFLLQRRIIWKVLLRIAIILLLPSKLAQIVLTKFRKFTGIFTLLTLIRVDIVSIQK